MTSKKRLKTEHNLDLKRNQNNDCFNRFDDKLMESILNYLPLKRKVVFTSVNKQFKRCLFSKQLDLIIDHEIGSQMNSMKELIQNEYKESDEEEDQLLEEQQKINKLGFNYILKNCKSINDLNLKNCLFDNEVIELICNNCPNLERLTFMNIGFDKKSILKLGSLYGKQLQKLVIMPIKGSNGSPFVELLANLCPNLKYIYCQSIGSYIKADESILPKLEEFDITVRPEDYPNFAVMVDKYKNQIKGLDILLNMKKGDQLCQSLALISKFVNLEVLSLVFVDPTEDIKPIDDYIEEIANNCKKLKSVYIDMDCCCYQLICGNLLAVLGLFHNSKQIKVHLPDRQKDDNSNGSQLKVNEELLESDLSCFKNCNNLSKFEIFFTEMTDNFVKDIDKHLPNLRSISLKTACDLSNKSLLSLSKLVYLKNLKISKNLELCESQVFSKISDSGVCHLLNSCKYIQTIVFEGRPDISSKTIDTLINIATNNPKRSYQFSSYCEFDLENKSFTPIDTNLLNNLPNNLVVSIVDQEIDSLDDEEYEDSDESDDNLDYDSDDDSDDDLDEDIDEDIEDELLNNLDNFDE